MRNANTILVGKPEETGPLESCRCRCEDNSNRLWKEQDMTAWIGFNWLRLWDTDINLRVPYEVGYFLDLVNDSQFLMKGPTPWSWFVV